MNNNLLTVQEHSLIGSTTKEFENFPYTPLAVLKKEMSIESCDIQRRLEEIISTSGIYWGEKYIECKMSLEPLNLDKSSNNYGETMRDPVLIKKFIFYRKMLNLSKSFPYTRIKKPKVELKNE